MINQNHKQNHLFFNLVHFDKKTRARAGILCTGHGNIQTPVFMPVGTQASVKTISPIELIELECQIILANTYHLYLRPGHELVRKAGGIQKFSSWHRPVLTDSGGYQVFSLAEFNKITSEGFTFKSHIDGSKHFFSPEKVIQIQRDFGSDIMMVLDECAPFPCDYSYAMKSIHLTFDWAKRSKQTFTAIKQQFDYPQFLFAIIQGGVYQDLRIESAKQLVDLDFPGYAIGGLSVGEPKNVMYEMTNLCAELFPPEKPRYLMGVGKPEDILEGIESGIDMFDCIIPTRNGRNGTVYTSFGSLNIKNSHYREDFTPLDANCHCYTCKTFSRSYLRHLYVAKEILVLKLLSYHNLYFYIQMMQQAREAILKDNFFAFKKSFLQKYNSLKLTE